MCHYKNTYLHPHFAGQLAALHTSVQYVVPLAVSLFCTAFYCDQHIDRSCYVKMCQNIPLPAVPAVIAICINESDVYVD